MGAVPAAHAPGTEPCPGAQSNSLGDSRVSRGRSAMKETLGIRWSAVLERGAGTYCQGGCDGDLPQGLSLPSSELPHRAAALSLGKATADSDTRDAGQPVRATPGAGVPSLPLVFPRERHGGAGRGPPPVTRTPGPTWTITSSCSSGNSCRVAPLPASGSAPGSPPPRAPRRDELLGLCSWQRGAGRIPKSLQTDPGGRGARLRR